MMDNQEILDMCRRLASKYYNHQDYDDIVSEGVVLCLNMRAEGITEPHKMYYRARDEMSNYLNVRSSNLSYPKSRAGRKAVKDDNIEYVDAEDEQIPAEDLFGSYELKNSIEVLKKHLSKREWEVFVCLHNNNNNLTHTSNALGVSKQAIKQALNRIKNKIVTICDVDI